MTGSRWYVYVCQTCGNSIKINCRCTLSEPPLCIANHPTGKRRTDDRLMTWELTL